MPCMILIWLMITFDHQITKYTAFAVHPTCVSLASPRSRCAYGYTGLGSVKSAFITGRLIKQFFTLGAKKQMLIQKEKRFVL